MKKNIIILFYIFDLIITIFIFCAYDRVLDIIPFSSILIAGFIIFVITKKYDKYKKLFIFTHILILIMVPIFLILVKPKYTPKKAIESIISDHQELIYNNTKKYHELLNSSSFLERQGYIFSFFTEENEKVNYVFDPWTGKYYIGE